MIETAKEKLSQKRMIYQKLIFDLKITISRASKVLKK